MTSFDQNLLRGHENPSIEDQNLFIFNSFSSKQKAGYSTLDYIAFSPHIPSSWRLPCLHLYGLMIHTLYIPTHPFSPSPSSGSLEMAFWVAPLLAARPVKWANQDQLNLRKKRLHQKMFKNKFFGVIQGWPSPRGLMPA